MAPGAQGVDHANAVRTSLEGIRMRVAMQHVGNTHSLWLTQLQPQTKCTIALDTSSSYESAYFEHCSLMQ